jgi:tetratricopeptide (TPR) repeat protein
VRIAAALLIAAGFAAYCGSFSGPFLYDDATAIVGNATLRHFSSALFPPAGGFSTSGRPVLNLSFALNYAISGTAVWSYHALNLLVHVLAGLALFGIVRRTVSTLPAFAVALLWIVHPLQTESVAYMSQRAESLMGLFYLLTLYCFIRGARIEGAAKAGRRAGWYALSITACLLGMGTKEVMVTAPVMVLLYDRAFVGGSFAEAWRRRRGVYLGLAATWVLLGILVAGSAGRGGTAGFGTALPWWAYAFTQIRAVANYLGLCFWPSPLIFDYGLVLGGPRFAMAGDAVLIAGLAAASIVLLVRNSPFGFLGAWFFIILAPSSSVVPVTTELIAEHRIYLSLAAVAAAAVFGIHAAWRAFGPRWGLGSRVSSAAGLLAVMVAGAALGTATFVRNEAYTSALALWADTVAKMPDNAGARNNLGSALADQGRLPEAIAQYEEALRLVPGYDDPHYNLGNALAKSGRVEEAIDHYRTALRVRPRNAAILFALGEALRRLGRLDEAQSRYEEALKGESDSPDVWCGLGNVMLNGGKWEEAAKAFGTAVQLRPDNTDALVNYAASLAQAGHNPEAARAFQAVLRVQPDAADLHNDLGGVLAQDGRLAEAKGEFERALRLKPDYREARDNLEKVNRMIGAPAAP